MSTKVKGLIKGLKYISQIFDEEKEAEIQIGLPTDVKHVAHIGWDGPSSAADNPSWMKEFKGAGALKSAPLGPSAESKEDQEIKWVSEDSKGRTSRGIRSENRDAPEGSKSSRCQSDNDGGGDSPKASKPRQSRRMKTKDPSAEPSSGTDVPKKSRRKKSRDFNADGCTRSTRSSRSSAAAAVAAADQGPSSLKNINNDVSQSSSSPKPLAQE